MMVVKVGNAEFHLNAQLLKTYSWAIQDENGDVYFLETPVENAVDFSIRRHTLRTRYAKIDRKFPINPNWKNTYTKLPSVKELLDIILRD
jgi:hypothetical protein